SPKLRPALPFFRHHSPLKGSVANQRNQRDGSFGLYMPKAYQKNRPFGFFAGDRLCIVAES
ncbi:MAG: hypothetical protein SPE23_10800, partial [Sodaliphilus sp.]|nr:hypothetical protein [Sodaliphilus sp.]